MDERTPPRDARASRRRFLTASAVSIGSIATLAGCLASSSEPEEDGEDWNVTVTPDERPDDAPGDRNESPADGSGSGDSDGEDSEPTPIDEDADRQWHPERYTVDYGHPVTQELGREPTLGKHPDETGNVIVEFDDISCEVCARFSRETFPAIASKLLEEGKATYVVRNFPRTEPWSEPATYALESVYARDLQTFWSLRGHLFANQSEMTTDNVLDRVASYLSDTPVDGDAVLADVDDRAYEETIDRNLEIRQQTGVFNTPTFFLFDADGFLTRLTGHQSYSVFENTLQL